MKILLAVAAFALAAVLVVSATMGAETLVPGDDTAKKRAPVGGVAAGGGKARILPAGPQTLKGTGFKPGENVTVRVTGGAAVTKRVRASSTGSFTLALPVRIDPCNGISVTAVGDKGSRTSFQISHLLCPMSGTRQ
jgi:hypothetical protein